MLPPRHLLEVLFDAPEEVLDFGFDLGGERGLCVEEGGLGDELEVLRGLVVGELRAVKEGRLLG